MSSSDQLAELSKLTVVVADTGGEFESCKVCLLFSAVAFRFQISTRSSSTSRPMPLPILRCCSRLLRCCVARLCGLALSLSRLQMKQYAQHIDAAIEYALKHSDGKNKVEVAIDKLAVIFGAEITKIGALFVLLTQSFNSLLRVLRCTSSWCCVDGGGCSLVVRHAGQH